MMMVHPQKRLGPSELENLRTKINDNEYLYEAIQRIALVLSNEIFEMPPGGKGKHNERKGRK
jgi:hypothetical protein